MNIEKGNKIVRDFIEALGKSSGFSVTRTPISRNVFEISGKINSLLYLKARAEYPLRWGVTANVIHRLSTQGKPWVVVLLYLSKETGYLLSSADVNHYTNNVWAIGADGDFKPSTGSYLANNKPFQSFDGFLSQLLGAIERPISIDQAIEEAKNEAEHILKRGSGESNAHKSLKGFIASNPSAICVSDSISAFQEYTFPSGDKVDVAFQSPNNHWTVVEIELQGLAQTLVGLFQSIKYKALQEAVLKCKNEEGLVDGVLVARSIPDVVKTLAVVLGIKTFEVDNSNAANGS